MAATITCPTKPELASQDANIVRPESLDNDALGRYVAEQTAGVLHRLSDLRPFYEELWRRFKKLPKGQTICGCRSRTAYAHKILGRSMRSIQYALYGRRKLKSPLLHAVVDEFVPDEFAKEERKRINELVREALGSGRTRLSADEKARVDRLREEMKQRQANAPTPTDREYRELRQEIPRPELRERIEKLIKRGRQALAKECHSDWCGGPDREMQLVNEAHDWLRAQLPEELAEEQAA